MLAAAHMLGVRGSLPGGWGPGDCCLGVRYESIPRVDKIVGPGNQYVTVAKKMVSFDCAIDFLAGPTEVVILTHRGRAEFVAADLVAQAEHDPDAMPCSSPVRSGWPNACAKQRGALP